MVDHQGQNGRERGRPGVVGQPTIPDAHAVAQHLQGGEPVRAGLVLDDDVDQHGLATQLGHEKQVGVAFAEFRIDERAVEPGQRAPVDRGDEVSRQHGLQQLGHLLGFAEDEAEQGIVSMDRVHAWHPVHRNRQRLQESRRVRARFAKGADPTAPSHGRCNDARAVASGKPGAYAVPRG